MSHEFKIVISAPADLSGAATAAPAFEKIEQQAGNVTAAATVLAGAVDRLAQAAAGTPNASLESLAAAARQTQASAGAAGQPISGLENAPEDFLAKLETGFGRDSHAKIIAGVEEIGHAFTEALQRGMEAIAGRQPTAVASGPSLAGDRTAGSTDLAAQLKDIYSEIIGKLPAASRAGLGDQPTDANLDAVSRAVTAVSTSANDPAAQAAKQVLVELLDRAAQTQANYHRAMQQEGTPAAGAASNLPPHQGASSDALERPRGTRQEILRHSNTGASDAAVPPPTERHARVGHAAPDRPDAARHPAPSQEHTRRRGERETFPIHGYRRGGDPGGGLHTGKLSTGGLGGSSFAQAGAALANPSAAGFGDPASMLARASTYAPSFPAAGASLAVPTISAPSLSLGTGAAANDPFSAAAAKFGDGAKDKLGRAAETLDGLTEKLGGSLGGLVERLQQLDERVDILKSQIETLRS